MKNVWVRVPCCFAKDPLKRDFLNIDVTIFLGVRNFGNKSGMSVILFFENVQNLKEIAKMQQKIQKKFFVFEILASKLVSLNCLS